MFGESSAQGAKGIVKRAINPWGEVQMCESSSIDMDISISGSVLILGNGYDRLRGIKSDYVSFLNYCKKIINLKDEAKYIILSVYAMLSLDNTRSRNEFRFPDIKEKCEDDYQKYLQNISDYIAVKGNSEYKTEFDFLNYFHKNFEIEENDLSGAEAFEYFYNQLLYFKAWRGAGGNRDELISKLNLQHPDEKHALIVYLILQISKCPMCNYSILSPYINHMGQWVDFEEIIRFLAYTSKSEKITGVTSSFSSFLLTVYHSQDIYQGFEFFKVGFIEYLANELKGSTNICAGNFATSNIISFNYTCPFDQTAEQEDKFIYYVHGQICDGEKCVFGYDDCSQNPYQELGHNQLIKSKDRKYHFSKQYQLLELNRAKPTIHIGKINKIKILGHSIGKQDYQYFFTLFDQNKDTVEIEAYWYVYMFDDMAIDNYLATKDSLFHMLREYEDRNNTKIIDRMFFERRIRFVEYDINMTIL